MTKKKCGKCTQEKSLGEFHKNKNSKDGRVRWCKECVKKNTKKYYIENREELLKKNRDWRKKNPGYRRNPEDRAQYERDNAEKIRKRKQKYYLKHKKKINTRNKKWHEENKERAQATCKKWEERNRGKRASYSQKRRAIKRDVDDGTVTPEIARALYEEEICCYCKKFVEREDRHMEHIHPLSRGGKHTITNIRMACVTCNLSKGNMLLSEYLEKLWQQK